MTILDASVSSDREQLKKIIHEMPSFPTEAKAKEAFDRKEIAEGVPFLVDELVGSWKAAIIVSGKFIFVNYDIGIHGEARVEQLKLKGVARLMEIADTKWVPTATMPYIPQKFEQINGDKVVFADRGDNANFDDAQSDSIVIDPEFKGDDTVQQKTDSEQEAE